MYEILVREEDSGKRIDNVVTKNLNYLKPALEISRKLVQQKINDGSILLNSESVKPGHKVRVNDIIQIDIEKVEKDALDELDLRKLRPEKLPVEIIYEDEEILIVNKPAGMVVHPACGNYSGTLVNALLDYPGFKKVFDGVDNRDNMKRLRPGIVHRLDKGTSGIMLVAKTAFSLRRLSRQLKNRTITKIYIAVVKGIVELDEGIINLPIGHDKKNRLKMAVDKVYGKEAVTYYRVLKRNKEKNFTVLEVRPKTGRTHQIRVHLSHIGHPLLGDILYNGPSIEGLSGYCLHSRSICFIHPVKNIRMEFSAEPPPFISEFLGK